MPTFPPLLPIINPSLKWKDFVSNRVSFIQETEPSAQWRFVPGIENPADGASRGITLKLLNSHNMWWNAQHGFVKNLMNGRRVNPHLQKKPQLKRDAKVLRVMLPIKLLNLRCLRVSQV